MKAILCVRGGYGTARILDKLDYKMIAKHPKMLIGFSDVTALHIAIGDKCGISTIHGPMLVSFTTARFDSEYTRENFFAGLEGSFPHGEIPMPEDRRLETVIPGRAEVGESPYRIDRMLNQLWQNGLLRRVNGIILGDSVGCENEDADGVNDFTLDNVLKHFGVRAVMTAYDDGNAHIALDN